MWHIALIRFLRRKIILALIFSLSLCYCIFSYMGKLEFLDNDEAVPVRRTQPFIWRTLQQHNSTNDAEINCRNSIQGKVLIADDRGYVCPRNEVLANGCCNDNSVSSSQYSCETCTPMNCCAIYEYCISCCLHPDKKEVLENVLGKASEQNSVLFASVTDHFELCLAKCRTNSQSVQHENSYKDPRAKHCYGELAPVTNRTSLIKYLLVTSENIFSYVDKMSVATAVLPTVYEYYTGNGISAGLSDNQTYFTLNNKNITIYSGAFHYFRVPRAYWRDRLRKMRAAGLNAVETYVPWNLHEPQSGVYDFGKGGSDMEDFLHTEEFFKTAQEEDLLALVRPGPYICAEWEFGGLPSWILRNTSSVRNSKDKNYLSYVKRYFNMLLPILAALQFQKGGPIIAFQIENEYANTYNIDREYLEALKQMFLDHGIIELLYTADPPSGDGIGSIPGVLQTANYNKNPKWQLDKLNTLQKNKPTMTMEYWTGWFDNWTGGHNGVSVKLFTERLQQILDYPSSVNMYMFVGSTNFGFLSGAGLTYGGGTNNSGLTPIVTSYDYDSPLTEYGAYTAKYNKTKQLIASHTKVKHREVAAPKEAARVAYPTLKPEGQMFLSDYLNNIGEEYSSENIIPMELLPINNNSGQSFGYILYRQRNIDIPANAVLKISGYVRDTVMVFINGVLVSKAPKSKADLENFGFWRKYNSSTVVTLKPLKNVTLDLVVENFGRNNYGKIKDFRQFKGLTDPVFLNDNELKNWIIKPIEFKKSTNKKMVQWKWSSPKETNRPAFYKFSLNITGQPQDTFVEMSGWNKGVTIVNGFVLGRHFFLAAVQTLYLPAPFLQTGHNDIIIFEHYNAPNVLKFSSKPLLTYSFI